MSKIFRQAAARFTVLFAVLCSGTVASPWAAAQQPPRLTEAAIEQLKSDGDRLADQGDYLGALQKYTNAYMGVVSAIRGQEFSKPIEPNVYDRQTLGEEMRAMMKEEYTPEELALMDGSFKAFGFVEPDVDTNQLITDLLTEQVAGFYDPDKKRMVLIVEEGSADEPSWLGKLLGAKVAFDKDEQKTTLAHELTHALQDQLYDLKEMQERIEDDDDMSTAFSAIVEGDATLLMFVEMDDSQDIRQMDPEAMRIMFNVMSWMLPLSGGESYRKAPAIFRDTLIFPYFQGMLFVIEAARREGWQSVHKLYSNPPVSTEQILHPAKYLDAARRDMPQLVKLPDLSGTITAPLKHLGGNVLGELQIAILLKKVVGGKQAAEGWDGDRYEIYQAEDGQLAMVFVSVWDSVSDAEQFEQAYRKYREPATKRSSKKARSQAKQEQNSAPESAAPDNAAVESGEPHANVPESAVAKSPPNRLIERVDDVVYAIEGFDAALSDQILAKLKGETTFAEKTFPPPKGAESL